MKIDSKVLGVRTKDHGTKHHRTKDH